MGTLKLKNKLIIIDCETYRAQVENKIKISLKI
jgi:hypothetical protein